MRAEELALNSSVPIEEFLAMDGQLLRDIQAYAPHITLQDYTTTPERR